MRGALGFVLGLGLLVFGFVLIGPLLDVRGIVPSEPSLPGGGPADWLNPPSEEAQSQAAGGVALALVGAAAIALSWQAWPAWRVRVGEWLRTFLSYVLVAAVFWALWVGRNLASSAFGWTHRQVEQIEVSAIAAVLLGVAALFAFGFVQIGIGAIRAYRSTEKRLPGFTPITVVAILVLGGGAAYFAFSAFKVGLSAMSPGPFRHFVLATAAPAPGLREEICAADDPEAAFIACTALIQSNRATSVRKAAAYNNLGVAYGREGRRDLAIANYTRSIALDPHSALAYGNRGRNYRAEGRYAEAIADLSQAIRIDPRDARGYIDRSSIYLAEGLYDQAIADSTKAMKVDPGNAQAYNERAWTYHLMGKDAQGLPDAEQAVRLAPRNANSIETRAEIYEKLGRRNEAIADYKASLKLKPNVKATQDGLRRLGAAP